MPTKTSSTKSTTTSTKEKPMPTNKRKSDDFTLDGHPLADQVPDSFFYDDYIGRTIAGVEDMDVLATAHAMRHNVLLAGPTGAAKTSFIYAYAAHIGMPVVNVACNGGVDIRQLLGGWSPTPDGTFKFQPGELVLGAMHGAIILLNEVNFMPPKIAAVLYGLLDKRRTVYLAEAAGSDFPSTFRAHPKTFVLADYNPGYQGTRPLNEAFKNRFAFKMNWGYEHAVEAQLVSSASLLEMGEKLRERTEAGDLITPIPTNALMEFEDIAWSETLGFDYAVFNFISMFSVDEQQVVKEVIEVYGDRIKSELDEAS